MERIIAYFAHFSHEWNCLPAKPQKRQDTAEVTYSSKCWALIHLHRERAKQILQVLQSAHIEAIVHGSVSRGDVSKDSDVDAFIPNPPSSFQIETALQNSHIPIARRLVIQATPLYAMKAYVEIDSTTEVSFPLMSLRRVEREFYEFSGEVNLAQLSANVRVAGVDKRLMLIEPTETGHIESAVLGREEHVAKRLGVAVETVLDRVRALSKRNAVGRTGVFIKQELDPDETFEMALSRLATENPAVRRRLRK